MRSIAIVGAGQAGVQLALGLQQHGHRVTLVSERTASEIWNGSVLSTQCMFHDALEHERALDLQMWENECPQVAGLAIHIAGPDGQQALAWQARLDNPAYAVDQRVKLPTWMDLFVERGGSVRIIQAGLDDLEALAREHDLVIVAAGKGALTQLFARDDAKSPYDRPQRVLALAVVRGLKPAGSPELVAFNLIPGAGEYIVVPGLTTSGPCHNMLFEAIPGGPLDAWSDVSTPDEHLARTLELLERWLPWEAERSRDVQLVDAKGVLRGQFAPTVRQPIGVLPSGRQVLGLADAVVLNDPITGQGSNNAAKSAASYLQAIVEHGDAPFDAAWMQATFDRYWEYASYVTGWTNAMLAPPPPHVIDILGAASQSPAIASRFVNGFNHPPSFFPWLVDPAAARATIEEEMSKLA